MCRPIRSRAASASSRFARTCAALPTVRSALMRSIDAANRYPEFLPERLRRLIAGHIGVRDEHELKELCRVYVSKTIECDY